MHIWQGKIDITRDEKQLIHYVIQPSYTKENIMVVNPIEYFTKVALPPYKEHY